jgi:hypothetical protein
MNIDFTNTRARAKAHCKERKGIVQILDNV